MKQTTINNLPSISVIITTHNRHEELKRAINSIAQQSLRPIEVVVVDDASDLLVDIETNEIKCLGLPLVLIRNKNSLGPAGARNVGIRATRGEWIAFLDDDDEYLPGKIETLTRFIAANNQEVDLVYHQALINMVNERVSYTTNPIDLSNTNDALRSILIRNVVGGTPMVAVRRTVLLDAGGFDDSLKALEDYELWIRLVSSQNRLRKLSEILTLCNYTTKRRSVTKSSDAGLDTFALIEHKHKTAFATLTPDEYEQHMLWRLDTMAHRAILNLHYMETVLCVLRSLLVSKSPKHLIRLIFAFAGPRMMIMMRARFGK